MRRAALLALTLACSHSRSEQHEEAVSATADKKQAAQEEEHVKKEEGAWLELDFAQPTQEAAVGPKGQPVQESNDGLGEGAEPQAAREGGHTPGLAVPNDIRQRGAFGVIQPPAKLDTGHTDGLPPHGALIKAVFHGPSTEELVRIAKMQAVEHDTATATAEGQSKDKSAPSAGCTFGLGVWGVVALCAMGAGLWLYLKR